MSEEIVEVYGVPDIASDGIDGVHIIHNVVRFRFWQWERTPGGILQKVCTAKIRITKEGMTAALPLMMDALGRPEYTELAVRKILAACH